MDNVNNELLWFPPEWVKAALVLALMSVWVVIALFAYLNRHTRERYFRLWTVAWMFYSVYLAAAIGLEETPYTPFLVMARRACIGISAVFLFWGAFELNGRRRTLRELGLAVAMIIAWSAVAAYGIRREYWITIPVFVLLAAAGVQTGVMCLQSRQQAADMRILGAGFILWGVHLLAFPFLSLSPVLMASSYLVSAILCSLITTGMVVEHQMSLSHQNYQMLFDSASDAMFVVNYTSRRILDANPSAQRIRNDAVGRTLTEVFPELDEEGAAAAERREPAPRQELRRRQVDGQHQVYEASANLMLLPQGPVLLLVLRDITERKRAEEALRRSNQQLEQALTELHAAQAQVIQQERLSALGQMASGVAHDFNNALAKILGFNELLLHTPEHLCDAEKVKKYLHMVSASAQEAVKIVNRLREFYRRRQDTDSYELVQLDQVIEQAIILTQPKWKDQMLGRGKPVEIAFEVEEVPAVRGNASDLREAVINLTFNAVDAMPEGGHLTYRVRHDAGQVVLEVSDTGTGMTEEVRRRCLEPFFTTKTDEGTGLGLAIVYGVVQRHGGGIAIRTAPGQGTTFAIRLPVAVAPAPAPRVEPAATEPLPSLRILVMDDEPLILDIEREYLCNEGHAVETARDGREGLRKFQEGRFDLVMVDHAMPQLNGEQVASRIKQTAPGTPVIMVTGFTELLPTAGSAPTDVDLVVAKPFSADVLRVAVNKAMARAGHN